MQTTVKRGLGLLVLALTAAVLAYWFANRRDTSPYRVAQPEKPKWTLVTSDGTDPWVVGVRPPDSFTSTLFSQIAKRSNSRLVAPSHSAVPLVLRSEFDDALQGAFGVDSIQRLAVDAGLDSADAFQPVCLAHHLVQGEHGSADLYFVPFTSAGFDRLRMNLIPDHPEQAGIGEYDPTLLTPVLVVAASENGFEKWWPLRFDRAKDCEADIQ